MMMIDAAVDYAGRGWNVIPLPYRSKGPDFDGWQETTFLAEELPTRFGQQCNIGIVLGDKSNGLVDVDLDCSEAVVLADHFLPSTDSIFGRDGNPRSHRLYVCEKPGRTTQLKDLQNEMLLEVRANGGQTVFPPSTHEGGEQIEWETDKAPGRCIWADLVNAARKTAAAVHVVRGYPSKGSRQDFACALAGALLRTWDQAEVKQFLSAVCDYVGDEEQNKRLDAVTHSCDRKSKGKTFTGWPRVAEYLGQDITERVRQLLVGDPAERSGVQGVLPGAPCPPETIIPSGWELDASGIRRMAAKNREREHVAPTPVLISERQIDLHNGEETLSVSYWRDGKWKRVYVQREVIATVRRITELANKGFPVTSANAKDLVEYLAAFEAANLGSLPVRMSSAQLGWQEQGFLLGNQFLVSAEDACGSVVDFRTNDDGEEQLGRAYHVQGSLEAWLAAVAPFMKHPRVRLVVYASVAAPLIKILGALNFIIELWGQTSSGKTTTLRIAASVWGNPDERHLQSLLASWAATRVYVERIVAVNNDLPTFLDETQRGDMQAMPKFVYDLCQGRGKGRGSLKGMQRTSGYRTIILTTGEKPLGSFRPEGGIDARILSIPGAPLGESSASSGMMVQAVNYAICQNYGHLGKRFIQYLLENRDSWAEYRQMYSMIQKSCLEMADGNSVMNRVISYFAVIQLAAELIHKAVDLPWEPGDLMKELQNEILGSVQEADKPAEALRMIVSWAESNRGLFLTDDDPTPTSRTILGRWDAGDSSSVAFYPNELEGQLAKHGYSPKAILRAWRDRDWLDVESGKNSRFSHKVKVNGAWSRLYVVRRAAIDSVLAGD